MIRGVAGRSPDGVFERLVILPQRVRSRILPRHFVTPLLFYSTYIIHYSMFITHYFYRLSYSLLVFSY